jgi:hypothetical protein
MGDELRATWASLSIQIDDNVITELQDRRTRSVRTGIFLPLYPRRSTTWPGTYISINSNTACCRKPARADFWMLWPGQTNYSSRSSSSRRNARTRVSLHSVARYSST